MKSFLTFISETTKTANTVLSDINEIYTGFILAGNKWFDTEAKRQFDLRVSQATPEQVEDAKGKAEVMAHKFIDWAKKNKYSGSVKHVWWTARAGSLSDAVGREVNQKKNPTDILIQFTDGPADGFLGLSAKATLTKGDIGFKNPGIGTIDRNLDLKLSDYYKSKQLESISKHSLPKSDKDRKTFIRANPHIKQETEAAGVKVLSELRDKLLEKLHQLDQETLLKYLLSDWLDAEVLYPPYIKVTGKGNKLPYTADVVDPVSNPKLEALANYDITLSTVGNESIGVMAGDKKIMKIRFKFESEKMASSMKLSGDPW